MQFQKKGANNVARLAPSSGRNHKHYLLFTWVLLEALPNVDLSDEIFSPAKWKSMFERRRKEKVAANLKQRAKGDLGLCNFMQRPLKLHRKRK